MKKRVTGIGGVFFRTKDPNSTKEWYKKHLGLNTDVFGTAFEWRKSSNPTQKGYTQWSPMDAETDYFGDGSNQPFMINYRVENLESLLQSLKEEGVKIVREMEVFEYGKFAHILDGNGNWVELWEPNDQVYDELTIGRTKS
jgi:predicted enzyme related to lactoylglutathione lyase